MFRPLRRKKNAISEEAAKQLLKTERRGTLAVNGEDGYPFAMPINYYYDEEEGKIVFHGSGVGLKIESIRKCDKVCFTVVGNEQIVDEAWAPVLQSVVVYGRCAVVEDREKTYDLLRKLAGKYYPNQELVEETIEFSGKAAKAFEITIENMCGKQCQEK